MITEKKPRSLLLTLGGAVLLIAGGATAYWVLVQRQSGGTIPAGVNLVPQQALMSISVSTSPKQWKKLEDFGTPETRQAVRQSLQDLESRFLAQNGYRYQTDVQPWVGDQITMAFLPLTAGSATLANQQSVVWILPIKDQNRARQALEQKHLGQTNKVAKRTYKGVEIQEVQGSNSQKYAMSVLDQRFLILTTIAPVINQVIDTYKGGASLAQTPRYTTALSAIQANQPFAQVYVNLPVAASQITANAGQKISPGTLASIEAAQGLSSTITLESEGMRFNSISWLKPGAQKKLRVENNAQGIEKRLPQNTLMMASGGNFKQFWQQYDQGTESKLVIPFNPDQFRASVQASTGMDFDQDFVSWMNGEFAAALVPAQENTFAGAGIILLAKTRDRTAAGKSFKQLDDAVRDRLNFSVTESKMGNQTLTTWKVPPGLPVASHGWLEDNVAFLTLGAPVANTILPQPQKTLASRDLFQQVTRSKLNPNNGHFFVDMPRILNLMDSSPLLPKLSPNVSKFAEAIQAIGVTAAVRNNWSTRYDIQVVLEKDNR